MITHDIPFLKLKKKIILNYPKSAAICSNFQGAQERVRNSLGKRAISVRSIEVLLYHEFFVKVLIETNVNISIRSKTPIDYRHQIKKKLNTRKVPCMTYHYIDNTL